MNFVPISVGRFSLLIMNLISQGYINKTQPQTPNENVKRYS